MMLKFLQVVRIIIHIIVRIAEASIASLLIESYQIMYRTDEWER